jgi:hypothetical protein
MNRIPEKLRHALLLTLVCSATSYSGAALADTCPLASSISSAYVSSSDPSFAIVWSGRWQGYAKVPDGSDFMSFRVTDDYSVKAYQTNNPNQYEIKCGYRIAPKSGISLWDFFMRNVNEQYDGSLFTLTAPQNWRSKTEPDGKTYLSCEFTNWEYCAFAPVNPALLQQRQERTTPEQARVMPF